MIPNYDHEIEKRYHPENFVEFPEDENDEESNLLDKEEDEE